MDMHSGMGAPPGSEPRFNSAGIHPLAGTGGSCSAGMRGEGQAGECFPHYILSVSGNLLLRDFLSQRLYPYLCALQCLMGSWRGADHTCGVSLGKKKKEFKRISRHGNRHFWGSCGASQG